MDGSQVLRHGLHGAPAFPDRSSVIVSVTCVGVHQVDIGMSSSEISFPLEPGDRAVYGGPFFHSAETIHVESSQARILANRISDVAQRERAQQYIARWERGELGSARHFELRVPHGSLQVSDAG